MDKKQDYKRGDVLRLTDTRVVRFVERGASDNDVLIVADRNDIKDIVREHQVFENCSAKRDSAYARE
jgi:hypothetical protein